MLRVAQWLWLCLAVLTRASTAGYYGNYYCRSGRDVVVHLFEWKWIDIEKECSWLARHDYCAVQVSPPMEHRIVTDPAYPWWQRYQPVSYSLAKSRSGTRQQLRNMITTCNNLGVFIYVDAVLNHMTGGGEGRGSNNSLFDGYNETYPAVPYTSDDFHGHADCPTTDLNIWDYNDTTQVRNCRLVGLRDLKGSREWVRARLANYMNELIDLGVAGFRLDAAKHMWPRDIDAILDKLHRLNTRWFPADTRPYIYQEVSDTDVEAVSPGEYTHIGQVTEFRHGKSLADVIHKADNRRLAQLWNYGPAWGLLSSSDALVFVDNHDTQRTGFNSTLTFFDANMYKIANAFQLAWPYGHVRIMSSYYWPRHIVDGKDQNDWIGPPSSRPGVTDDVVCFTAWICEHRWRQLYNMVRFHNIVMGQLVNNWWDNGYQAIAFGRGDRGFIVINIEDFPLDELLQTGLPEGQYCDVISCDNNRPPCRNSGATCRPSVYVDSSGFARFNVPNGQDPLIAIHQ